MVKKILRWSRKHRLENLMAEFCALEDQIENIQRSIEILQKMMGKNGLDHIHAMLKDLLMKQEDIGKEIIRLSFLIK